MGRTNGTNTKPQAQRFIRSQLPPNRELQAALAHPRPRAFGIRRRLGPDCETALVAVLKQLQKDDDIPAKVELRDKLHVTLLSSRAVGRQMMRGLVAGYELGKKSRVVKNCAQNQKYAEPLSVLRSDVRVYQGYSLYLAVESAEITDEITEIHQLLGAHGIKGFLKDEQKLGLHISLGAAKQSSRMSKTEQRHVEHVINDHLVELPIDIPLQGWEVYP